MSRPSSLPRYDPTRSYAWNYANAPDAIPRVEPQVAGAWDFCGLKVASPLGVSAGPLLNGQWCLYYASLGFDVVTYKTVRSRLRDCYALPNLQPVRCGQITDAPPYLVAADKMQGSWAVSYGMPSADPNQWRRDIEWTREQLPAGKLLSVSVVGSYQDGWSLGDLADDYALCAQWAVESGADCVETNFSCPNVSTCDGQLYQSAEQSRTVASAVRGVIGKTPYIIKIGHLPRDESLDVLLDAVGDLADALAMTNSIATKVMRGDEFLFDGQQRGICGTAIRDESIRQIERFARRITLRNLPTKLIGVGGISTAEDVQRYLAAGAHACHLATSLMMNPAVGLEIREQLSW